MKTQTLSIRVPEELKARLADFENTSGVESATLVRAALIAALDHYESAGGITFPLSITDSKPSPTSKKRGTKEG